MKMVHLDKDSNQKQRICMLPDVKRLPKMTSWVPINQNDYFETECNDEKSDDESAGVRVNSWERMTNMEFVELIDALVLYQVKDNNTGTIGKSFASWTELTLLNDECGKRWKTANLIWT